MNTRRKPADAEETDPHSIETAAEEIPAGTTAPEVNEQTAELTSWDETPDDSGVSAPRVTPEDEAPAAELLVQEGLEEADRDRRIAAADPDFEP